MYACYYGFGQFGPLSDTRVLSSLGLSMPHYLAEMNIGPVQKLPSARTFFSSKIAWHGDVLISGHFPWQPCCLCLRTFQSNLQPLNEFMGDAHQSLMPCIVCAASPGSATAAAATAAAAAAVSGGGICCIPTVHISCSTTANLRSCHHRHPLQVFANHDQPWTHSSRPLFTLGPGPRSTFRGPKVRD